tara:strand:- start:511 stop:1047 length:537 start_codon:yes stop_codon:yes gene_type:complete
MKKINKKKGILFWITGLSGAGKTTIGIKIKNDISKKYGPTLMISGDNIRNIFDLKGYEYKERLEILKKYTKFAKYITDQKLNIILAVVGMADAPRKWNRENIDNYVEIYIKSNIQKIINLDKKKIYHNKKSGKIIGIDIKPQFPKKPDITIINSFNETSDKIAKKLLKKITNLIDAKK